MEMPKSTSVFRGAAMQSNLEAGTPEATGVLKDKDIVTSASTWKPIKKFTYQDKRRAAFVLSKAHSYTENTSEREELVKWAKSVLPNFQPAIAGKRQRPFQEQVPQTKRMRMQTASRSFADVTRNRILIGVLDRGSTNGQVPRDRWRIVENELQDRFLNVFGSFGGLPPICEDAGWHQGSVKAIACQDVRSAILYKKAVASLGEVYPGAMLEAVDWNRVPSKPRARVWVSEKPAEPDRILRLLQVCNPHLPTANWKVAKVEDAVGLSRQIILTLDTESAGMILKSDGLVCYGFKKVAIRIYKSDTRGRQVEAETALEVAEANQSAAETVALEDDILDGYVSEESDLARGLRSIVVEDLLSESESDSDVTLLAAE
ncbi:uncharacterized protein LOC117781341 [Drosophila innubila]|uniref:uncharacterized protein LOC117781341 n=1 Tax=Drosophila innubila TaxID=198719 RepID=UPI00148E4CFB|nr:uncharacterized protein LOC117781341 [Drosophila innubila]